MHPWTNRPEAEQTPAIYSKTTETGEQQAGVYTAGNRARTAHRGPPFIAIIRCLGCHIFLSYTLIFGFQWLLCVYGVFIEQDSHKMGNGAAGGVVSYTRRDRSGLRMRYTLGGMSAMGQRSLGPGERHY